MKTSVPVGLILATLSVPGIARDIGAGTRPAVTVKLARADLSAATPILARRTLYRIDRAATAACGGGGGSLREVTKAVRASACWREAVGDTVRRIDAPLLTQAWHNRRLPETRA